MILDISTKLGKEKQEIKIAEGMVYEVDNSAETMLKAEEKFKNISDANEMFSILELFLGHTASIQIRDLNPTVKMLQTIIIAIMAQVNEEDFDEFEKRFQESSK